MASNLLFARKLRNNDKKKDELYRPVGFRLKKTNVLITDFKLTILD